MRFPAVLRQVLQVNDRNAAINLGMDKLYRAAILLDEISSQHFMAADDFLEDGFESGQIKAAIQTDGVRHVVSGARSFQLV